MSWDVMIFNFGDKAPLTIESVNESDLKPLGPADDVRQRISRFLPGVDWTDPTWGLFGGDGFSIEFSVGDKDPIGNIMLHVRGGGEAIAAIMSFARPLGWWAYDCSTGDFLDPQHPSQAGWEGFQRYRDKIITHSNDEDGG